MSAIYKHLKIKSLSILLSVLTFRTELTIEMF